MILYTKKSGEAQQVEWSKIQTPTDEVVVPYDSLAPIPDGNDLYPNQCACRIFQFCCFPPLLYFVEDDHESTVLLQIQLKLRSFWTNSLF